MSIKDLPLLPGYIQAIFEYPEDRVCETCKTNDEVHYNMHVFHGYDHTNPDPDIDVWCQKCGETNMVEPEEADE